MIVENYIKVYMRDVYDKTNKTVFAEYRLRDRLGAGFLAKDLDHAAQAILNIMGYKPIRSLWILDGLSLEEKIAGGRQLTSEELAKIIEPIREKKPDLVINGLVF